MTPRILVMGDSHVACLRAAHADGAAPEAAWTFLGAHKGLLLETVVEGARLRPASDAARAAFRRLNGLEAADLAVDAVVVVGGMMAPVQAARVWRDMRWPGLPSLDGPADLALMRTALVSRACACAVLSALLRGSLAMRLAAHLGPGRPLWLASQPRPSASVLRIAHRAALSARGCVRDGDGEAVGRLHEERAEAVAREAGLGYVPQPNATVEHGLLTGVRWMAGAMRLAADTRAGPADDVTHTNAAYGALMLGAIAAAVAGSVSRRG